MVARAARAWITLDRLEPRREDCASGFVSQYKNLADSYIHQSSRRVAQSFWAGLGAVRATAFLSVGGFDEPFPRPCVEDIDLGYRLTTAGHRVLLDSAIRGCHLKRWTLRSLVLT
jgi:GT2 family glycosyltransferase